ncbi:hypothetical protein PAXINDRAFT_20128 [Paxillus involutus ATCC 200175]|uniref:Uncharacterized protein n=1 Tax=Paxillus involutus ATCC 200175 TaxID=664439 RepID=A0A0C9SVM9_PAXIN|nr:hypothetical protein PAXINDRAFT_20128 [Paxillus involutus ATCC 200175]
MANISPDDPECQTSKAYQKGYIVPNNTVTSDHLISDNQCGDAESRPGANGEGGRAGSEAVKGEGERGGQTGDCSNASCRRRHLTPGKDLVSFSVKRTPSEDDGRPCSDEDEAEPNLLDVFYDPPCDNCTAQDIRCHARLYNSKKWMSCVFCRGRKQGCTALATFPAIKTSTNKVLHAANSWQDLVMRGRPVTKGKRSERSKSIVRAGTAAPEDIHMQSPKGPKATKVKKGKETRASPDTMDEDQPSDEEPEEDELVMWPKGQKVKKAKSKGKETRTSPDVMDEDSLSDDNREELQALLPMVDKGKGRELPLPSLAPAPSLVPAPSQGEVDIVETRTATLVQQMAKQLTNMQGWDAALNEIDQIADAEDIQWDCRLVDMDRLLGESHERHLVLKAQCREPEFPMRATPRNDPSYHARTYPATCP